MRVLMLVVWLMITGVASGEAVSKRVDAAVGHAIEALSERQRETGAWTPEPGPAVTAMVLEGMLAEPGYGIEYPPAERALGYVLSFAREDGGIHGGFLQNYNTSISIAALAYVSDRVEVADVIDRAHDYLRGLQWVDQADPQGDKVTPTHPYFGGAGYGGHGRPDLSNTAMMISGLRRSGLDAEDVVYQRALVFLTRLQGVRENDLFDQAVLPRDGGFIYATSVNLDRIGVPESKASPAMIDEALAGRPVSGLRSYGTMTYAGFMSYLYAELDRDDPRVRAAYGWLRENYVLDHNPGMPEAQAREGLFYYYLVMARALSAWGDPILVTDEGGVAWAEALAERLLELQGEDGLWVNDSPRWMEGDPNLATAYAILALQELRPWIEGRDVE
ncbi:prenyltransferase/squalene oxidase repeat-containing protein [Mucisphaera calidilacus]|uniref:Squalene cyclase C-terminal domain-containing protein n=1 Tax=Mucisphaera calidilacus TaxID=2527982 RepID=A0A518BVB8_9BACT|nr:hypothetical protein [Mucisphaera calidilacus]QDU70930.1 hypothetical protein Pan265_07740 [Mucisphaera calidilacus]